jgi:nicotinate-nucleotide adenylyltransferase
MVAAWVVWSGLCDEVWLVPVPDHPFGKVSSDFRVRCALAEAMATDVGPFVRVSRIEGERSGPHYTVDTLRLLRERHRGTSFRLLLGADLWPTRTQWREWTVIERDFAPIVVGRGPVSSPHGHPAFPAISSTEVRAMRASGRPLAGWVTAGVLARWTQEEGR